MKTLNLALAKAEDVIDRLLDRFTTYRLVLYALIIYVLAAAVLTSLHKLSFTAWQLLSSVGWLIAVCGALNWILAKLLRIPANQESYLITALILSLIMTPATNLHGLGILAVAGFGAIASKFILTWHGRHIFNPAALGALIAGVGLNNYASWWVGTKPLAPLVLIGGFLIVKRIRRMQMVAVTMAIFLSYTLAYAPAEHAASTLVAAILDSSLLFFATIMLTEPLTSPTTLNGQLVYAVVVGGAYSIARLKLAPEEALLVGNILTFIMSPNRSMVLKLVRSQKEASGIYSYIFETKKRLAFIPGQYMEWTLPGVRLDSRGNRRYLTIASSPTEPSVAFTIKVPPQPSGFKSALGSLKPGGKILAAQLAGDFVLPEDPRVRLAFLAGGIGVTPFRSMVKSLLDHNAWRNIVLIYNANDANEFAYTGLFKRAASVGLTSHFITSGLDVGSLAKKIPDFRVRRFYISGPQGYVAGMRQLLLTAGVPYGQIVTDFFPGYN